ncbi:MAG: Spo0E family sporulation regulatory protein-aspartic acid phosphatase [Clostridiaceae bacterium]|nr:Spo0E family sporulation regulatory protein-aspartic acid phosphatase [Clostridiaceae bacterium]
MSELKKARKELYEVIESGSREQIMEVSQDLDKIILRHMYNQLSKKHL